MISVAMTTYNAEKYIIKQLYTLINQTRLPDEIVIVDDCSRDSTVELVKDYFQKNSFSNYKLIVHEKNEGYIPSFRESLKNCIGEYIFLCDHDDEWCLEKISDMLEIVEKNSEIKLLACSFNKIDSESNQIKTRKNPFSSNNNLIRKIIGKNAVKKIETRAVLAYNISMGCSYLVRKEIVDNYLNIEVDIPHDWALSIIASLFDGLYFYNKPLINYRIHSNNTIGLTRNLEVENRLSAVMQNKHEKDEMLKILYKNKCNMRLIDFQKKLISLFELRIEVLNKKRMTHKCLKLLIMSLFKQRIIESSLVDIYIVMKNRCIK